MKKIKIFRSVTAIICSVCLVIGCASMISWAVDSSSATPPTFDEITFSHFGAADGIYSFKDGEYYPVDGQYSEGFANKTFVGTINFSAARTNTELHFTGTDKTNGIRLFVQSDNSMVFQCIPTAPQTFESVIIPESAVSKMPIDQDVEIKLSTEVADIDKDGQQDDVRFWLYIDGTLYQNKPIEAIGHAQYLGDHLTILTGAADHSVKITSKVSLEPPTFDEITFSHFGAADGIYSFKDGEYYPVDCQYSEGFANKTFVGTINFSAARTNTELHFTGTDKTNGIRLYVQSDNSMVFECLKIAPATFERVIIPESAVSKMPIGQDVEIKLSTEVADIDKDGQQDDVRFWLYIDGTVYRNEPIEAIGHAQYLGNHLTIVTGAADHSVTILSKATPPTFPKITFSDFQIDNDTYGYNNESLAVSGGAAESCINKTFVGTVNFSSATSAHIRFAGYDSGWQGVVLYSVPAGLVFLDTAAQPRFEGTTILVSEGAVKDQDIEIKLSFEVLDLDNDGTEDDVRFWLYLDGKLCRNQPIAEAIDYAQYLGKYIGIYASTKDANVTVKSKVWTTLTIGDATNGIVECRVAAGDVLPQGYYQDKYICSWSSNGKTVTTYSSGNDYVAEYIDLDTLDVYKQEKEDTSSEYDSRIIGSIDGQIDRYVKVGFVVSKINDTPTIGEKNCTSRSTYKVYEQLCETTAGEKQYRTTADVYGNEYSKYMFTLEIKNIPVSGKVYVRAYVVFEDGRIIYGEPRTIEVPFWNGNEMPIGGFYGPMASYTGTYTYNNQTYEYTSKDFLQDSYFKLLQECGVNLITSVDCNYKSSPENLLKTLEFCDANQLRLLIRDVGVTAGMTENEMNARLSAYRGYKSFAGLYIVDEPTTEDFPKKDDYSRPVSNYKDLAVRINNYDNMLGYINLYPYYPWNSTCTSEDYKKYIKECINSTHTKFVSFDHYVFDYLSDCVPEGNYPERVLNTKGYFKNLSIARDVAKELGVPYWGYIQCGSQWKMECFDSVDYYPTETEFTWNVNTTLAMGAKGIQYFPLIQPHFYALTTNTPTDPEDLDGNRNGLINAKGEKTQWYDYAKNANMQIRAVDEILMNTEHKGVMLVGKTTEELTSTEVSCLISGGKFNEVTSVSAPGAGAMIGCFDYYGKTVLYVVNYDRQSSETQNITISLDKNHVVTQVSAKNTSQATQKQISLSLKAGEAVLIQIEP